MNKLDKKTNGEIAFLCNALHNYEKTLTLPPIAHLIKETRETIEQLVAENGVLEEERRQYKQQVDKIIYEGHEGEDYL